MRLWQLLWAVLLAAMLMAIARDDVGRVALVVFFTGLGEVAVATTALMLLFRTVAAIGDADGFVGHVEALAATALVLIVATALMNALLWFGLWAVQRVVFI